MLIDGQPGVEAAGESAGWTLANGLSRPHPSSIRTVHGGPGDGHRPGPLGVPERRAGR